MLRVISLLLVSAAFLAAANDLATRKILLESLENLQPGTDAQSLQNGVDLYKYLFEHVKDFGKNFKGKETYTPQQVQEDPYFARQGQKLLVSIHTIASICDQKFLFHAYTRELMDRHEKVNALQPAAVFKDFWPTFIAFLKTKGPVSADVEQEWIRVGNEFGDEAKAQLEHIAKNH